MKLNARAILLLAMLTTILSMLIIIIFFYSTGMLSLFQSNSRSYGYEIIKETGKNINSLITQALYTEKRLSSSARTSQILLGYEQLPNQQLGITDNIERLIWNYKQSASYISDIYLFGYDNRLFSTTTTTNLESLKSAPWVYLLDSHESMPVITSTHNAYYDAPSSILQESQKDKHVISFVRKIYHLGSVDKYSIVQMDLKYSEIQRIMDSVDLGINGFAVIINEADQVIYCRKNEFLGKPMEVYLESMEPEQLTKRLMKTEYKLENIDWRIIGYVSTEFFSQEFSSMNRMFYMALTASLVVAIFLIMILTKNIVSRQERDKAAMEYQALQNQINPHFLYNTLNTLKWMALVDNNRNIADAIVSLVKMLKFTCDERDDIIPISNEISFLQDYISIQKLRYGDIEVEFQIQPELMSYGILKFILQPIVENCFIHGFSELIKDRRLLISGKIEEDSAVFLISDNGVGIETKNMEQYSGLGIKNVDKRLLTHFGSKYKLKLEGKRGKGTTVKIRIPLIKL